MKAFFISAASLALAQAAAAAPVAYTIDNTHAIVTWEVKHLGTSTTRGMFRAKDGTVSLDREAKEGKVNVTLDMGSLYVAVAEQLGTLRGERAFNVAAHPSAGFESTRVVFDGDRVAAVEGNLTIAGKTQPATLKATAFHCAQNPMVKREVCGGDFETVIKRSQFGLGFLPQAASDEVRLLIQVEAVRQD